MTATAQIIALPVIPEAGEVEAVTPETLIGKAVHFEWTQASDSMRGVGETLVSRMEALLKKVYRAVDVVRDAADAADALRDELIPEMDAMSKHADAATERAEAMKASIQGVSR